MIDKPTDAGWLTLLLMIAAASGAVGGCGGAAHIFMVKKQPLRFVQFLAYVVLGMFMSLVAFSVLGIGNTVFGWGITMSVESFVGFCLLFGFGGSLALSGVNVIVSWTTKRFGRWEVKFTARQDGQDRRKDEGD